MKRIVIASDGTWSSPENSHPTNVLRLARAIAPVDSNGNKQVVFYDWGLGTDRKKISGGISGEGINKNILDCYRFIVQNYSEHDELFFFGFSRGAYTVRSLAGMIRNCGILKRENAQLIPKAFQLYRARGTASAPNEKKAKKLRSKYCVSDRNEIKFIGVWDTVGALGIPFSFHGMFDNNEEYLFHDTSPSRIVNCARQALSIDESREDFEPVLWDDDKAIDLKQVWFSGVHSDIGGGYEQHGLADIAFEWILKEAMDQDIEIEQHLTKKLSIDSSNILADQHSEYKGAYKILRKKKNRKIPKGSLIHESVKKRFKAKKSSFKSPAFKNFFKKNGSSWERINIEH